MVQSDTSVLVVEDEPILRVSLADHLEESGYRVLEAATADQAWTILQSDSSVHVLVTDVRMPGSMDGWELARRVREARPEVRVIVTTATFRRTAVDVHAYVPKPYQLTEIATLIRDLA